MAGNEKEAPKTKLFEKVKFDLMSEQSSVASLTTQPKLDKQALGYEEMLIKLENDVRQHIRVEQQLKLHIEQVQ